MIRVLIGGDVYPSGSIAPLFERGDAEGIFNDLLSEFRQADISLVNLESPLIRQASPAKKIGFIHSASDSCINGIKQAGIHVLNLGNNHIMDHGSNGLRNTIETCQKHGILHVGAGKNIEDAKKILIQKIKGVRIGILSLAEHEFSIATKSFWGANPLDIIDFVRNVKSHRQEFDYLIVLLHGGNEQYPYPRPSLMDTCRFFVEEGASAVICQHSHCPGCYEVYGDSPIVYGQGNLIFEPSTKPDKSWYEGFLVVLHIGQNCKSEMEIIPYTQFDSHYGAKRMQPDREKEFRAALNERTKAILDETFVQERWNEFCGQNKNQYLSLLYQDSSLVQRISRKLHFPQHHSEHSLLLKLSLIRSESLRDILLKILSGGD